MNMHWILVSNKYVVIVAGVVRRHRSRWLWHHDHGKKIWSCDKDVIMQLRCNFIEYLQRDHEKMMMNPQNGAWDENKNMAGTKWVAVRNIPQKNLLGEKIGFFTRPILFYPCGAKCLTQRSRPPRRWHDHKWVKCGLWAQKKRLPQDIPQSLVNGLTRRKVGVNCQDTNIFIPW